MAKVTAIQTSGMRYDDSIFACGIVGYYRPPRWLEDFKELYLSTYVPSVWKLDLPRPPDAPKRYHYEWCQRALREIYEANQMLESTYHDALIELSRLGRDVVDDPDVAAICNAELETFSGDDGTIGHRHSAPQGAFYAVITCSQHHRDDDDAILLPEQQRCRCQPAAPLPHPRPPARSCSRPRPRPRPRPSPVYRPRPSPVYRPADYSPPCCLMPPSMMFLPSPPDSQISSVTASVSTLLRPFFGLSTVRTRHFLQSIHTTHTHTHRTLHLRSHDANEPLLSHSDAAPISDSSSFDSTPVLEPAIPPPSAMDRTSTQHASERTLSDVPDLAPPPTPRPSVSPCRRCPLSCSLA